MARPRKAESFRRLVAAALADQPTVPTRVLLERATAEGYDGQKSAFYAMVATERDPAHTTQRRTPLPGESSRHDVFHLVLPSGLRTRLFVSRLDYSRRVAASVLCGAGIEPVARALCSHFVAFGGAPLLATFESLRTGVAGNESLIAYLGLDLGVGIELPDGSRAGARLSRTIRMELASALSNIKDDGELAPALASYVEQHNAHESSDELFQEELRRLRLLRVPPSELTLRVSTTVQPGNVIVFETNRWFVRAAIPGTSATVFLSPHRVRIVAGSASAIFSRDA